MPYSAPSPVYNGALSFHYSLQIGEMAESFPCVYVSTPVEMQAKYKVVLLWNHTVVCKLDTLIGYWVVGVSFTLGVEKWLRRDKFRLVKMSYLSRVKIGKTGKYWGNSKIRKKQKNRGALVPSNLSFIKKMSGLYQKRETSAIPFRGNNYITLARCWWMIFRY